MYYANTLKWALAALSVAFVASVQAQSIGSDLGDKKSLTLAAAKKIAMAAEAEAIKNKWNVVIAVVDDGGHLVYLQRMDGTQTGSVNVAIKKALTAQAFKRPTKVFEDAIAGGRNALLGLDSALPLEGGLPLNAGTQLIGGIGVSGVTAQQDGIIAKAGADLLTQ